MKIVGPRTQNLIGLSIVTKHAVDWYPDAGPLSSGAPGRHWSDKRLFSIGDSHAGAYAGLFRILKAEDGVSVYIDSLAGQLFGSFVYPASNDDAEREAQILEHLRKLSRPGDVVLLALSLIHI